MHERPQEDQSTNPSRLLSHQRSCRWTANLGYPQHGQGGERVGAAIGHPARVHTSTATDLAARAGGVIRRTHLLRHGATDADVRRWVRGEVFTRLRDGVLALPDADALIVVAARHGGSLACASALRAYGIWLWDDAARVHVWLGSSGRRHFVLDGWIILETDGRENHDGASLRHKDLRRDALAAAQGFTTLRFDDAMVLYEWDLVEAAVLARRRGRPA